MDDMEQDNWKLIDGFDGKYETDGMLIRNAKSKKTVRPRISNGCEYYRLVRPDGKKCERSFFSLTGIGSRHHSPHIPWFTEERAHDIIERYIDGASTYELGNEFGVNHETIRKLLIKHGIKTRPRGCNAKKAVDVLNSKRREESLKRNIPRFNKMYGDSFEFVSGSFSKSKFAIVRCRKCGTETSKHIDLKSKMLVCPVCKEAKRKERELEGFENGKQLSFNLFPKDYTPKLDPNEVRKCPECGAEFVVGERYSGVGRIPTCCSAKCQKKHNDRNGRYRRRERLGNTETLSWHDIYSADSGCCYLCGEKVDSNDFRINESGALIAGDNYPTVEHVVCLMSGGSNTMDNARLAHKKCNEIKGTKSIDELANVGTKLFRDAS